MVPPNHAKQDNFSIETYDFEDPPFYESCLYIYIPTNGLMAIH